MDPMHWTVLGIEQPTAAPQSGRSIDNGRKPGSVGFAVESDAHQCHRHDKAEAVREAPGEQIVILCRHQKAGAGEDARGTD